MPRLADSCSRAANQSRVVELLGEGEHRAAYYLMNYCCLTWAYNYRTGIPYFKWLAASHRTARRRAERSSSAVTRELALMHCLNLCPCRRREVHENHSELELRSRHLTDAYQDEGLREFRFAARHIALLQPPVDHLVHVGLTVNKPHSNSVDQT
jgi:hypothetical protein